MMPPAPPMPSPTLAFAQVENPVLWAVVIGWILSVVLHEFAHGLVGYWGGDHTIRERGGLTLNPLQYVDPLFSLIIPAVILLIGGIPLPGGVTYVRRDLLRSRAWDTAVSLAGPAMNLILFFVCLLPLHPSVGWVDYRAGSPERYTTAQMFLAVMAFLQLGAVLLNLIPVPPLDGFGAIAPYLNPDFRDKVTTPPTSTLLFFGFFAVMLMTPLYWRMSLGALANVLENLGFPLTSGSFFTHAIFEECFRR